MLRDLESSKYIKGGKSIPAHKEDLYVQVLTAKQRIELESFPPAEVEELKKKKKNVKKHTTKITSV